MQIPYGLHYKLYDHVQATPYSSHKVELHCRSSCALQLQAQIGL